MRVLFTVRFSIRLDRGGGDAEPSRDIESGAYIETRPQPNYAGFTAIPWDEADG